MVKSGLLAATALLTVPAFAASGSIDKIDVAKGEVLLEVQGDGQSLRKVTESATRCTLTARGVSAEAAKATLDGQRTKLQNAAKGVKVSAEPAYLNENEWAVAEAAAVAVDVAEDGSAAPEKSWESERFNYQQQIGISASSLDAFQKARTALSENDCDEEYQLKRRPILKTSDEVGGKEAAIADAIKSARGKADSYASAMNMRVVGVLRVSEVGAVREFLGSDIDRFFGMMRDEMIRDYTLSETMPVSASVTVDFVLGPK